MAKAHNEDVYRRLKPGDLVEFKRGAFSHWGVCVDEKKIVHLGVEDSNSNMFSFYPSGISIPQTAPAEVVKSDFWTVAQQDKAYINNSSDKNWNPLPAREIVKRAESKLGRAEYNLFSHNCEHFANWCRYNKAVSKQVEAFQSAASVAVPAGIATTTIAGALAIILFRMVSRVN